ncbi:TetR/AcrR family transcriptional regulator [Ornithinimicrobium faecis]|uniref:TetR/AcrR family transcriptional regulator n=1 Tax=Ornithinimicrobium faecis TaxID=2934158 RepID=A0ABY4YYV7_9MICO|nr:TetR/AcrR family transcriptional regulator [Ornithinimicrobium sp. HY1793]USQ81968.1 TetR/AcrR family transcriptional regulator [Ornithinimicrobium sp. HY1793]
MTTQPSTRRELNKARTRERLLEALRAQLSRGSLESMTVEEVAEAAGVSRRTFFNYFTSLEAALAEGMSVPIEGMSEAFRARPAEEVPLVAMDQALQVAPIPRDLLSWIAAVKCSGLERHSVAVNVWAYHQEWFEGLLRERLPRASDLAVTTLAGTVMAIFEAAERHWMQTPVDIVDDRAAADFNDLLRQGLQLAAAGWVTPAETT